MEKFIKIFKALSDETRLRIYLLLLKEELCVCELENILDMEQSRVSHALRFLKEAGLVNSKRDGTWIIYSVNPEMLESRIIQEIKHEISLTIDDLKNLDKCKKEGLKVRCKSK